MDFKIIHIEETDSTNRWMAASQPHCDVVVAEYQTAGKGCGTNTWESERGKNLTFSVMLHPTHIPAVRQFDISRIVSVAICETLEHYINNKVEIKWPNDIYVGNRKICGILIENRLQGTVIRDSIVGIGLNVNQWFFRSDAPNPVSLYQLTGQETDREELLKRFLGRLDNLLNSKTSCFGYEERLFWKEGKHPFKDKTSCFTAAIDGVTNDGRLVLVDEDGLRRVYAFKEVTFLVNSEK